MTLALVPNHILLLSDTLALAKSTEILTKTGLFTDITGLEGNQKNAIRQYLSNNDTYLAMAEASSLLGQASHSTNNAGRIVSAIQTGKEDGLLADTDASGLYKKLVETMIDGGKAESAAMVVKKEEGKPSLKDAMTAAVNQGKDVKVVVTHPTEGTQSIDVKGKDVIGSGPQSHQLTNIPGTFTPIKQQHRNGCWAYAAQMMLMWHENKMYSVYDAVKWAGDEFDTLLRIDEGLTVPEYESFIDLMGFVAEEYFSDKKGPIRYVELMNMYGPLMVAVDSAIPGSAKRHHHAKILIEAGGTGTEDGEGTDFIFLNPSTGKREVDSFKNFIKSFDDEVIQDSEPTFLKVVHFAEPIPLNKLPIQRQASPWDTLKPVHEYLTKAALEGASITDLSKEIMRGVIWNDDPAVVLFDNDSFKNMIFSRDERWNQKYKETLNFKNITARCHFGDLQCLHAMAATVGELPNTTISNIFLWFETMYKVAIGTIGTSTAISNTSIAPFFGTDSRPTESQTVEYLLYGCTSEFYLSADATHRALGVCLHIIQDIYNGRHARRALLNPEDQLPDGNFKQGTWAKFGPIEGFYVAPTTPLLNSVVHDSFAGNGEMNLDDISSFNGISGARDGIDKCGMLVNFWSARQPWEEGVNEFIVAEVCELSDTAGAAEAATFA